MTRSRQNRVSDVFGWSRVPMRSGPAEVVARFNVARGKTARFGRSQFGQVVGVRGSSSRVIPHRSKVS